MKINKKKIHGNGWKFMRWKLMKIDGSGWHVVRMDENWRSNKWKRVKMNGRLINVDEKWTKMKAMDDIWAKIEKTIIRCKRMKIDEQ